MEVFASLVITVGLSLNLLQLTESRWISDTVIVIQCTLVCAFFYDSFFRLIQPGLKSGDFRGVQGPGLSYAFLVPCSYIISQKEHMTERRNDPITGHVTLALIIVPVLYQILQCVTFSRSNYYNSRGLLLMSSLPWIGMLVFLIIDCSKWLGHNMAITLYLSVAVGAIMQLIITLKAPTSFTMSEATIITQGILLLAYQSWRPLFFSLAAYLQTRKPHVIENLLTNEISEIDLFTLVAVTSACIVLCVIALCVPCQNNAGFYMMTFLVMGGFSLPVLLLVLKQNFISWMYGYIIATKQRRQLFIFWVIICIVSVITVAVTVLLQNMKENNKKSKDDQQRKNNTIPPSEDTFIRMSFKPKRIRQRKDIASEKEHSKQFKNSFKNSATKTKITTVTRKVFHLIAIVTFLPGIYLDPPLLSCAACCALVVFLFLECMRVICIWPIGKTLNEYLDIFRDKQDQGTFILTPIYLLVGLTLPLWLHQGFNPEHSTISLLSGVISLGIGDAAASVVGSNFGHHKWPGSSKSVEGSLAFVLGCVAFVHTLCYTGVITLYFKSIWYIGIILCSLLEACTMQIDNLVLPLFMFCLLETFQ